jgi:DNA-binding NtrC family response regulator
MIAPFWLANGDSNPLDEPAPRANSSRFGKYSARARVLVVDDEPLIRWSLAESLRDHGYEVCEAGAAAAAVEALRRRPADVVLLDLWLPDSADLRLLSAMRRTWPGTPVILMTAYGTRELSVEARHLGAFAVLDKPFDMDAIHLIVRHALTGRPH